MALESISINHGRSMEACSSQWELVGNIGLSDYVRMLVSRFNPLRKFCATAIEVYIQNWCPQARNAYGMVLDLSWHEYSRLVNCNWFCFVSLVIIHIFEMVEPCWTQFLKLVETTNQSSWFLPVPCHDALIFFLISAWKPTKKQQNPVSLFQVEQKNNEKHINHWIQRVFRVIRFTLKRTHYFLARNLALNSSWQALRWGSYIHWPWM